MKLVPAVVAHCDWSIADRKRWMAIAVKEESGWSILRPRLVGQTATMLDRLRAAARTSGSVLVGFDFPIGVPEAYGKLTGLSGFREGLSEWGRGSWERWFTVCDESELVDFRQPFYPSRPGGRRLSHLTDGLGLSRHELLRKCERSTDYRAAGCPLFWTLGANQVGKGAISGWQELLIPSQREIALWPFDGALEGLVEQHAIVVCETYPADVYHRLGIARAPRWSKTAAAGRASAGVAIEGWLTAFAGRSETGLVADLHAGFGSGSDAEDRFDAVIGLLGMLDVVDGRHAEGPLLSAAALQWEGWILGQAVGKQGAE
ncbi:DUF429 domain-containing protein [Stenotrophomonas sp. BIO128-Bstrain]|uniref:DUF429 domain-containing protein n=1 Tax=Stenotrophomonas sp. BIO128-Bstrain TaxID=3027225 RepID=UPI0024DEC43F|nr:DUF429 domain-containing protein [Stenotrophomonas sp. BIO128-Bstrain]WIA62589.1 DUF429 domain-containing protein [Stenotrophomonas sp. BIO128-Bstrain]